MAAAAAGQVLRLVAKGLSKLGKKGKTTKPDSKKKYPGKAKRKPGQTTQWRKDETVQDIPENDPFKSPKSRARAKKERLAREAKKGVAKTAKPTPQTTRDIAQRVRGEELVDEPSNGGSKSLRKRPGSENVPRDLSTSKALRKTKESYAGAIKDRKKWLKELKAVTPRTTPGGNKIWKSSAATKRHEALEELLESNMNKIKEIEEKGGTVFGNKKYQIKKYTGLKKGGKVMPKKMSRVGLSPAEESRSGTMSEAKRKRYAGGGKMQQGYDARKDEQLGMTRGKEAGKKMSMAGRRNVAKATRKPRGTYGFKKGGPIGVGVAKRGWGATGKH
jgi:hypothetical protein